MDEAVATIERKSKTAIVTGGCEAASGVGGGLLPCAPAEAQEGS